MFSVNRLLGIEIHCLFTVCSFDQLVKTRTKLEQIRNVSRTNSVQMRGIGVPCVYIPEKWFRRCAGLKSGCSIGEG